MKLKLLITFVLILLLPNTYLKSQALPDTTSNEEAVEDLDKEDTDTTATDSLGNVLRILDPSLIPAEDIYNNWNNLLVNPYGVDLVNKSDTTVISLNGYYHPFKSYVTSGYGWRKWQYHLGTDIKLQIGDTVHAAFDGMIRISKRSKSFGNFIVIRHYNGLETVYGHLSKLLVMPNQFVKAGDIIGLGGNTGRSTGPHLHFEVRYLGNTINPTEIIDFNNGVTLKDTLLLCKQNFKFLAEIRKVRYHTVRRGDTLGKISHKYGISIKKLCSLNHISRRTVLKVGRKLRYT